MAKKDKWIESLRIDNSSNLTIKRSNVLRTMKKYVKTFSKKLNAFSQKKIFSKKIKIRENYLQDLCDRAHVQNIHKISSQS